jgi:hypothetical protein
MMSRGTVDAAELLYLVVCDEVFRLEWSPWHFILNYFVDEAHIRKFNLCGAPWLGFEAGQGKFGETLQMVDTMSWGQCDIGGMLPGYKVMSERIHVLVVHLNSVDERMVIRKD